MTREHRSAQYGAGSTSDHAGSRATPGKTTQVMASYASEPPAVQRKQDAVQRKGGSAEPTPPDPVYQYGPGTKHLSDCGPASVLTLLRLMNLETNLRGWILAHRPMKGLWADPAYQKVYPSALPSIVDPQEELDVARACTGLGAQAMRGDGYRLSAPITTHDGVMKVTDLRAALVCLLQVIGAQVPANFDEILQYANEGDDSIGGIDVRQPGSKGELLRYLYRHCADDKAIIVLGAPTAWHPDAHGTQTVTAAWGWGGAAPSPGGRKVGIDPSSGHFVVVHSFNRGTKKFTVLDPSFARPQYVSPDQLVEFIANRGGSLANMLTVPLDTVQSWMPATQP